MTDVPKGKVGLAKGVIKSLRTLDFGELYKNFKAKPTRTVIKTFLAGTGAEGAAGEIYNQFKAGNFSPSKILGKAASNIAKRAGQVSEFAKKTYKEADLNEGGMAYARKKNMGLKMKKGGSVTNRKARGTGAAKRGTNFKGTF